MNFVFQSFWMFLPSMVLSMTDINICLQKQKFYFSKSRPGGRFETDKQAYYSDFDVKQCEIYCVRIVTCRSYNYNKARRLCQINMAARGVNQLYSDNDPDWNAVRKIQIQRVRLRKRASVYKQMWKSTKSVTDKLQTLYKNSPPHTIKNNFQNSCQIVHCS